MLNRPAPGRIPLSPEKKTLRRNSVLLTLDGMFFQAGYNFISGSAVLSVFIEAFTGSMMLAGLSNFLEMTGFNLGKLLLGPHARRVGDHPRAVGILNALCRPLFFIMAPLLLLPTPAAAVVAALMAIVFVYWVLSGMVAILWSDLFARVLPPRQRGTVASMRLVAGGVLAALSGIAIQRILGSPALMLRQQYAIIFSLGALIMLGTIPATWLCRDKPRQPAQHPHPLMADMGRIRELLTDQPLYRRYLPLRALAYLSEMMIPFVVLLCKTVQPLTSGQVGWLVYLFILGKLTGGFIQGVVSRRLGNRAVVLLMQALAAFQFAAGIGVLLTAPVPPGFLFGLATVSGLSMGQASGCFLYSMDVVDESMRMRMMTVESVMMLPLSLLPWIMGFVLDRVGFMIPLVLCLICALMSVIFIRLKWLGRDEVEDYHRVGGI